MKRVFVLFCFFVLNVHVSAAQDVSAQQLFYNMRTKLSTVKDYVAEVKMKINISFMRVPTLSGKLYFKSPDKMKLERNGGISILPKKSISLTLNNLVPAGDVTVIDAGEERINGKALRVIKVVPDNDQTDIVLTKIWVDETRLLAIRTETTTRENGTISMDLQFGKYAHLALPDHVIFHVDVKDFKVPKGVTMDYDTGEDVIVKKGENNKPKKGTIRIDYLSYEVNKGLSDQVFIEK
ncbi:MAG TPA: hypothetical protein PL009_14220 [Flavipsychrobacter sp.]|nr:hypothetical protein [Flavipsychrobacter sp.]